MTDLDLEGIRLEIEQVKLEVARIHRYHNRKFWVTVGILLGILGLEIVGGLF